MANYLEAHPEDAEFIANQRQHSGFVPIARNGEFVASINPRRVAEVILPDPFTAEDYVVGMELLGHTFHLIRMPGGGLGLMHNVGLIDIPASWDEYVAQLSEAFGRERDAEVRDFLLDRGDGVVGEAVRAEEPTS